MPFHSNSRPNKNNFYLKETNETNRLKKEYNIVEIHKAISSVGATAINKSIKEICIDENLRIISAPCYMMDAKVDEIYANTKMAIDKLSDFLRN